MLILIDFIIEKKTKKFKKVFVYILKKYIFALAKPKTR